MQYLMVPTSKEMLFLTDILFSQVFILSGHFSKTVFFPGDFLKGHFQDLENEFVIFQVFYNTWEP